MAPERIHCDHCGKMIESCSPCVYSVRVDHEGCLQEIIEGEPVAGDLHYCSDACMFTRGHGIVPGELFKAADSERDTNHVDCGVFFANGNV